MQEQKATIIKFIEQNQAEMVALWQDFVDTPSPTLNPQAARKMALKLYQVLAELGFSCEMVDVGGGNAPAVVGIWGQERAGQPLIFSGHYDTVALPGEHPFRLDERGHVHGLGCLDMKGGLVVGIFAIKALQAMNWQERPIKVIFLGDEEVGHHGAKTAEIIQTEARGALCAINLETGLIANQICVGRKGSGSAYFEVAGVGAHSGNDFLAGRNAIAEMAHKILAIQQLTDISAGTTVSVTMIKGGTVHNGIPPKCSATVDIRYESFAERERILQSLQTISQAITIDGCQTTFTYHDNIKPFETTPAGVAFANFIARISQENELGEMTQVKLGGGSDAAYLTLAGVPTVCSLGVRGEFNHTDAEYALVDSLYERVQLVTNVVLCLAEFMNE